MPGRDPACPSQSASISVVPAGPAMMSNQYQPPSMNGASGKVRWMVSGMSESTLIVSIG